MTYTNESVERLVEAVRMAVNEQAEDDALWFDERNIGAAYIQQELRRLHHIIETALSSLTLETPRVCEFEKYDDRSGMYYTTTCGHEIDDNETSDTFKFCPYCGGEIKEIK